VLLGAPVPLDELYAVYSIAAAATALSLRPAWSPSPSGSHGDWAATGPELGARELADRAACTNTHLDR